MQATTSFFESLNESGITYCHWKSNWALTDTLSGKTDIDLLVARNDASRFRALLDEFGFRPAIEAGVPPLPSVEHYHAMDEVSGSLMHVHAYYRVVTGESLAKNYRFPVEEMLLTTVRREGVVTVPTKGAELVLFVPRMMLKHTGLVELAMAIRDRRHIRAELEWLLTDSSYEEAVDLLAEWIPEVDEAAFRSGVEAVRGTGKLWKRVLLGYRMRVHLRPYARHGTLIARISGARRFLGMAFHRVAGTKKALTPAGGGAVIAFVGSEATGKTTLLEETEKWLGQHYTVRRIHSGKPPSTALTILPNLFLPVLRAWIPSQRSTHVEAKHAAQPDARPNRSSFSLLHGIRSVMLAHDRRVLLTRAFARSANGAIVLCDRYPSSGEDAPDGPALTRYPVSSLGRLRAWLVSQETRMYRSIPRPDLVIHLTAPLEVTLQRNQMREKTEPEDFVRLRHRRTTDLRFEGVRIHRIHTDRRIEESLEEVRHIIWNAL